MKHVVRKRNWLVFFALLPGLLLYLSAGKFWDEKSFTEWTEKQCLELLRSSPWVVQYSDSDFGVNPNRSGTDGNIGSQEEQSPGQLYGGERDIVNFIQFRFVSAKPVKMAIARLRLLKNAGQAALEREVRNYIDAPTPGHILVAVNVYSRPEGHHSVREIENFFRQATLPTFQAQTYLASTKEGIHVPISGYVRPSQDSPNPIFLFPRYNDKKAPLFTGDEKQIFLNTELDLRIVGAKRSYRIRLKLEPAKMKLGGEFSI
jgi:hypothetical protein